MLRRACEMKQTIVIAYIVLWAATLFTGEIANDLIGLGIRQELINIIDKALAAALGAVGLYGVTKGIILPVPPAKEEPGA